LQITYTIAKDLPVLGQKYTFGIVKARAKRAATSRFLPSAAVRALRVHLGKNLKVRARDAHESRAKGNRVNH